MPVQATDQQNNILRLKKTTTLEIFLLEPKIPIFDQCPNLKQSRVHFACKQCLGDNYYVNNSNDPFGPIRTMRRYFESLKLEVSLRWSSTLKKYFRPIFFVFSIFVKNLSITYLELVLKVSSDKTERKV